MYQESKRINEETNKQQGKKSDPPLEYIKTDNEIITLLQVFVTMLQRNLSIRYL